MSRGASATHPVFLLGMHRGGTTYVQRLLNCHPDVTIYGENGGLVTWLRRAHERFGQTNPVDPVAYREFGAFAQEFIPWATPVSHDAFAQRVASLITSVYRNGTAYWGFKEIRHCSRADIDFLCRAFPDCRILLLVRHPRDVMRSRFHVAWSDARRAPDIESHVLRFCTTYARAINAFAGALRTHRDVHLRAYESIRDVRSVRSLFDVLDVPGARMDVRLVRTVLRTRAGSSFVDVGRTVSDAEAKRMTRIFDRAGSSAITGALSTDGCDLVRSTYPDVIRSKQGSRVPHRSS